MTTPAVVSLDHWQHPVFGDRWSVVTDEGRTILTYGTELEARRQCRAVGWVVRPARASRED